MSGLAFRVEKATIIIKHTSLKLTPERSPHPPKKGLEKFPLFKGAEGIKLPGSSA